MAKYKLIEHVEALRLARNNFKGAYKEWRRDLEYEAGNTWTTEELNEYEQQLRQ
jgi:hypothetical protein